MELKERENEDLKNKYKKLLDSKEKENEDLKNKSKDNEKTIEKKNNEIKRLNDEIKRLNEEINKINTENNSQLEKINKDFQKKINQIKDNNIKKDEEIEKLKKNKENLEKELNDLNNKNKELNEKVLKIENDLKDKIKINDKINKENEILKNNINNYNNEINEYKNKNNNNEKIIKDYKLKEGEINKRSLEITEKEEEYKNKIKSLKDKEAQIKKENKEIIKKEILKKDIEENKKIKKENKFYNLQNDNLEKEINKKKIEFNELDDYIIGFKKYKEQIYKNKNENIKEMILILYSNPTLIGLKKIGKQNFINATLQCLSQTKLLAQYSLRQINRNIIKNNNDESISIYRNKISPIFMDLIQNLWSKFRPKTFSPINFLKTIEELKKLKLAQFNDCKDFIIFILEQIHNELKKPVSEDKININLPQSLINNNAFKQFFSEFKKECSIISDIFFGITQTTQECLNCKNNYYSQGFNNSISYNYEIFKCISLSLEEIIDMKKSSKNFNNNKLYSYNENYINFNDDILSLDDCFFYKEKMNTKISQNKIYCSNCKQECKSILTTKIFSLPTVLILLLNNKNDINKNNLEFNKNFNLYFFCNNNNKLIYNLYGVITYINENDNFVAFCKSPIDNNWYRYNDEEVNLITNFQKEVIEFGIPQVLFFSQKEEIYQNNNQNNQVNNQNNNDDNNLTQFIIFNSLYN